MTKQLSKALALGAVMGFLVAAFPACGPRSNISRCNASNCDGCCDDTGSCFKGISTEACGAAGASCMVCSAGQTCERLDPLKDFGGKCTTPSTGGGAGGGSGGGTGGGSGGGSGGGTGGGAGGGAGGGDGGAVGCNATNCANGCCTPSGTCVTQLTPARCGTGGARCASCTMGNTCVGGVCTPCSGCVETTGPQAGQCLPGTTNAACGTQGVYCQQCNANLGENCTGGACMGSGTCNATNCLDGCCDGNTCVPRSQFTNARCGVGVSGGACTTCQGVSTCDLDAGVCVGNMGTGGGFGGGAGGGIPGLDGGLPDLCTLFGTPCRAGQCCDLILIFPSCVNNGEACFMGGTCNGAAMTCQ
jgi:hypothetical protein